jgi:hypothetical protein
MLIEPWVTLNSSCRYRGDSVGSGTTEILESGASLGGERSALNDTGAASIALNNEEPRHNAIRKDMI